MAIGPYRLESGSDATIPAKEDPIRRLERNIGGFSLPPGIPPAMGKLIDEGAGWKLPECLKTLPHNDRSASATSHKP